MGSAAGGARLKHRRGQLSYQRLQAGVFAVAKVQGIAISQAGAEAVLPLVEQIAEAQGHERGCRCLASGAHQFSEIAAMSEAALNRRQAAG